MTQPAEWSDVEAREIHRPPTPAEVATLIRNFEDAVVECVRLETGSAAYTVSKWALEDALRKPDAQPLRWLVVHANGTESTRRTEPTPIELAYYAKRAWAITPLYAAVPPAQTVSAEDAAQLRRDICWV